MPTIVSWNVNGLRSNIVGGKHLSNKKAKYTSIDPETNLGEIIKNYNPDILCFQEIKCDSKVATDTFQFPEYHQYFNSSKGVGARTGSRYSGTAIWTKEKPENLLYNIPNFEDNEGRVIIAEYTDFILINTYVPNSGSNFDYRIFEWNVAINTYLTSSTLIDKNKYIIWAGDLNVAYTIDDTCYTTSKYNSSTISGCLKEEINDFKCILDSGFVDAYRKFKNPQETEYTWFFNQRCRELNKGMRIDYFIVDDRLAEKVLDCGVINDSGLKTTPLGSDHLAIYLKW